MREPPVQLKPLVGGDPKHVPSRPAPPQVDDLARAQKVRMAARGAGVASVTRRPRKWRLRLDSTVSVSPNISDALSSWPGSQLSPTGEITLPNPDGHDISALLEFLQHLKSQDHENSVR